MTRIQKFWERTSTMLNLPQFQGKVLDVGEGELRCPYCNRLFFRGEIGPGTRIEIKCSRRECGQVIRINKL